MAITSPGYDDNTHFNYFEQHDAVNSNIANTSTNTHRATRNDIRTAENDFNPQTAFDNSLLTTSTNTFIFANGSIVGMVQSFNVSESRGVNKLQAIGWEGVVQAVPENTKGGSLTMSRIALYESQIWNALGLTTSGRPFNQIGAKVYDAEAESGARRRNGEDARHLSLDEVHRRRGPERGPHSYRKCGCIRSAGQRLGPSRGNVMRWHRPHNQGWG